MVLTRREGPEAVGMNAAARRRRKYSVPRVLCAELGGRREPALLLLVTCTYNVDFVNCDTFCGGPDRCEMPDDCTYICEN